MRIKNFIIGLVIFIPFSGFCGENDTLKLENSAIFFEFIGHSRSFLSLNFEQSLLSKSNFFNLYFRIGLGYIPGIDDRNGNHHSGTLTVPLVLSSHIEYKNNFCNIGIGYTGSFSSYWVDSSTYPASIHQKYESAFIVSIGYRRYFNGGGFIDVYPGLQWTNNPTGNSRFTFGVAAGEVLSWSRRKKASR